MLTNFPNELLPRPASRRAPVFLLAALLCFVAAGSARAQAPGLSERPANLSCVAPERPPAQGPIQLDPVLAFDELRFPLDMMQQPGDSSRWFVVERSGFVAAYTDGQIFTPDGTFIDITDRVTRQFEDGEGNEMGLLGMVFHPDFSSNGQAFLYYSAVGDPLVARLSRFTSNDGGLTLDPSSEQVILELDRDRQWHWGGKMHFGDDGYLYMAFGDGGPNSNAQKTDRLFGKMIRIDVDSPTEPYAIPPGNMFENGGGRPEIWAMGFRNPWRWSFDRVTGELWLGDVGGKNYEEINLVTAGGNYGWSVREGLHCSGLTACTNEGFINPVVEYAHSGVNAVIGGFVYRGSAIPSLYGVYIYADISGTIFALHFDEAGNPDPQVLLESGEFILSFGAGIDDELYVLARSQVFRVALAGPPPPSNFPQRLSETGCFLAADPTQPASGVIPYDLNVPLWSDGAEKHRWFAVPDATTIDIDADGDWMFPIGSVLIKSFSLDDKLVETRLFIRHDDGGWGGYSYEWNEQQTDATLLDTGKVKQVGNQQWLFPSSNQCMQCHTAASGRSLGLETPQLNRSFTYPGTGIDANQLMTLESIGMFSSPLPDAPANLPALPAPDDELASLEERARGYLHSNCAMCHRPGGPGQGPEDFRHWVPLSEIGAVDVLPTQGDMGVPGAKLLAPGHPEQSILALRLHALDDNRMPPLGSSIVDPVGSALVDDWIGSMSSQLDPCGKPSFVGGQILATFVWKDCETDRWHLLVSGDGQQTSHFVGSLSADQPIGITPVRVEGNDILDLSNPVHFVFDLVTNYGIDGFDIAASSAATMCLSIDAPAGAPLLVGPNATPVNNPFDLVTLEACQGVPSPDGAPSYDPALDSGAYLWRISDGSWRLRVMSGGVVTTHVGTISSDQPFAEDQVQGVYLGSHDVLDTTDPRQTVFYLTTRSWQDGIDFSLPGSAQEVCLDIQSPEDAVLRVGPEGTPSAFPVNLVTLAPCSTTPSPFGTPSFDVGSDRAAHLWQDLDKTWKLRVTGGGTHTNYTGRIQLNEAFDAGDVNGVFINASDVVDTSVQGTVSFSLNVLAWQDGIDFKLPATVEQACLYLDAPNDVDLRLGGSGLPVPIPFDLLTLGACEVAP